MKHTLCYPAILAFFGLTFYCQPNLFILNKVNGGIDRRPQSYSKPLGCTNLKKAKKSPKNKHFLKELSKAYSNLSCPSQD